MRIFAPSNDVRSQSLANPGTFVTTGVGRAAGVHFATADVVGAGFVLVDDGVPDLDADEEQAASAPTRSAITMARARPDIQTSIMFRGHEEVVRAVEPTADPTFSGAGGVEKGVEQAAAEFEAWVSPHLVAMARLASRLAGEADRDDVVQDALTRAWQKSQTFDPNRGSVRVWLLAIVAGRARRARRRRRDSVLLAENAIPIAVFGGADIDLERAVASLPKRMRLAVECVYFVDLSIRDTAEFMRVTEGTIKSTLHDARALLRSRLEVSS
jgi:RNA polymerase sigma factor (sigma-70 family)